MRALLLVFRVRRFIVLPELEENYLNRATLLTGAVYQLLEKFCHPPLLALPFTRKKGIVKFLLNYPFLVNLVGAKGFESSTPCSQSLQRCNIHLYCEDIRRYITRLVSTFLWMPSVLSIAPDVLRGSHRITRLHAACAPIRGNIFDGAVKPVHF